jgi:hypothetical protein
LDKLSAPKEDRLQELKCRVCDHGYDAGARQCPTCQFDLNGAGDGMIGESPEEYEERVQIARRAWETAYVPPAIVSNNGSGTGLAPAAETVRPAQSSVDEQPAKPAAEKTKPPATKSSTAAAKPVSLGSPVPHRLWAFVVGAGGCYLGDILISGVHDLITATGLPSSIGTAHPVPWILLLVLGKVLPSIVVEETREVVQAMVWTWVVLTALGVSIWGWALHDTVVTVTYVIAGIIGIIGVVAGK